MKKYLLLAVVVLLSGCASTEEFKKYADGLVGQPKEVVIKNLGIPSKEYKINDKLHLLHYDYSYRNSFVSGMANGSTTGSIIAGTFFNNGYVVKYIQLYIDENDKVAEVKYKNMP